MHRQKIEHNNLLISLNFSVKAETKLGEHVCIAGNIAELGEWNLSRTLKLITRPQTYPYWTSHETIKLARGVKVEFKMLVKTNQGDILRWEAIVGNRTIVPTASMTIIFQDSQPELDFDIADHHRVRNPGHEENLRRKRTEQILNELEDQSDSSSDKQKNYWLQFMRDEQRACETLLDRFKENAKEIAESRLANRDAKPKRFLNELELKHIVLVSEQEDEMPKRTTKSLAPADSHGTKPNHAIGQQFLSIGYQVLDFISTTQCIEKVKQATNNNSHLVAYHLILELSPDYQNCIDLVRQIRRQAIGFIVLHVLDVDAELFADEKMELHLHLADVIVFNQFAGAEQMVEKCCRHANTRILQNQVFCVSKLGSSASAPAQKTTIIIEKGVSKSELKKMDMLEQQKPFFSRISCILGQGDRHRAPADFRTQKLYSSNILQSVRQRKFCILICCDKLNRISQRTVNHLISISTKQRIQIYILTNDEVKEIGVRLALSKTNSLMVLNSQGDIVIPVNCVNNIFEIVGANREKYSRFCKDLKDRLSAWVENRVVEILNSDKRTPNPLFLELKVSRTSIGLLVMDFIEKQCQKTNASKHRMSLEKWMGRQFILIKIQPLITSPYFYCRTILSISHKLSTCPFILHFDLHNSRDDHNPHQCNLIRQISAICLEYGMRNEGFDVMVGSQEDEQSQLGRDFIKQAAMISLLEKLEIEASSSEIRDIKLSSLEQDSLGDTS